MIPKLLIALRFVLGPLLFLDAADGSTTPWFLVGVTLAVLSDWLDGVLARRWGTSTARLREADGWTDVWFYLWIAASLWQAHRALILAEWQPIALVIAAQVLAWIVDLVKYRRFSNYHTYLGKSWGATLFLAVVAIFGFGTGGIFLWIMAVVGTACALEEIAITLTLPTWTHDVPSIFHARRLRA
jgi:CDP-diacylglycerol--glycerol-3-phosphate 3-phosphatidyltransferase